MEYWTGAFDVWGDLHHVLAPEGECQLLIYFEQNFTFLLLLLFLYIYDLLRVLLICSVESTGGLWWLGGHFCGLVILRRQIEPK